MGNGKSTQQGGKADTGHVKSKVQAVAAMSSSSSGTTLTPGKASTPASTPSETTQKTSPARDPSEQAKPQPPKEPKPDPEKQRAELERKKKEEEKRHQEQLEQYKRRQQEQVARQNEQRRQAALRKKQAEEADRRLKMLEAEQQRKEEQERLLQQKEEVLKAKKDWEKGQQTTGFSTYAESPVEKKVDQMSHFPRAKGFDNDKFRKYNQAHKPDLQITSSPGANMLVLSPDRSLNQTELSPKNRGQHIHNHFPESPNQMAGLQHLTPQKSESPMPQVQFDDLEENLMDEILSDLEAM